MLIVILFSLLCEINFLFYLINFSSSALSINILSYSFVFYKGFLRVKYLVHFSQIFLPNLSYFL